MQNSKSKAQAMAEDCNRDFIVSIQLIAAARPHRKYAEAKQRDFVAHGILLSLLDMVQAARKFGVYLEIRLRHPLETVVVTINPRDFVDPVVFDFDESGLRKLLHEHVYSNITSSSLSLNGNNSDSNENENSDDGCNSDNGNDNEDNNSNGDNGNDNMGKDGNNSNRSYGNSNNGRDNGNRASNGDNGNDNMGKDGNNSNRSYDNSNNGRDNGNRASGNCDGNGFAAQSRQMQHTSCAATCDPASGCTTNWRPTRPSASEKLTEAEPGTDGKGCCSDLFDLQTLCSLAENHDVTVAVRAREKKPGELRTETCLHIAVCQAVH